MVDHGTCFSDEPKLRTVLWDYIGEPISDEDLDGLRGLAEGLRSGTVRRTLDELLSRGEVRATIGRLHELLAEGRFPEPGPGRPYPWPIV